MSERRPTPWLDDTIAPNGRPVRENFALWFGNSKVTSRRKPRVVFHGTPAQFNVFEMHNGTRLRGAYFTTCKFGAEDWGSRGGEKANIIPVFLSIQNPATDETSGAIWAQLYERLGRQPDQAQFTQALIDAGFDGYMGSNLTERDALEFIAFFPEQIKSASSNSGNYDPTSPCIEDSAPAPRVTRGPQP